MPVPTDQDTAEPLELDPESGLMIAGNALRAHRRDEWLLAEIVPGVTRKAALVGGLFVLAGVGAWWWQRSRRAARRQNPPRRRDG